MSVLNWFKRIVGGEDIPAEANAPSDGAASLHGLDVMATIDAHMAWKSRLESFIRGQSDETLKIENIRPDNLCSLGQWIYGEGHDHFGHLPVFKQVRQEHARFHLCAARTLDLAAQEGEARALEELNRGDYSRASQRVKHLLAQLYLEAKNEHP
ncbi:CZB domain-containing protein [Nitrogeniibacter aestuarii]|uniref:CZB domain-containing protein n=1 Tax=Nitrogeniibacter aestuarii TaxID=2815343 RepID=UPI001D106E2A|nr:CZB domain-containing protein [Nitrogeniibacter aestuarii]